MKVGYGSRRLQPKRSPALERLQGGKRLQRFGQLFRKRTLRRVASALSVAWPSGSAYISGSRCTTRSASVAGSRPARAILHGCGSVCGSGAGSTGAGRRRCVHTGSRCGSGALAAGRLSRIGAQQAIFQRRPVKAPDDRLHLLAVRSFDKCEAFGFLSFRVADDFDRIGHQALGRQPGLDVVSGHPYRQVSEEDGATHSIVCFLLRGDCFLVRVKRAGHGSIYSLTYGTQTEKGHSVISRRCVSGSSRIRIADARKKVEFNPNAAPIPYPSANAPMPQGAPAHRKRPKL